MLSSIISTLYIYKLYKYSYHPTMEDFMVPVIYDHPDGLFKFIHQHKPRFSVVPPDIWKPRHHQHRRHVGQGCTIEDAHPTCQGGTAARRHGHVGPPVDDFQCECWCIFNSTLSVYQGYHGKCLLVFKPQVTSSLEVA